MKFISGTVILVLLQILSTSHSYECEQLKSMNIFIGSGGPGFGDGSLSPAAQYPFGALRLGPDTTSSFADISFRHFSGYHYLDNQIRGFSHTHLVGAGVNDLGNIGIMPISLSQENLQSIDDWTVKRGWWSSFNKSTESASPGYYTAYLNEPKVQAEMLAISTHAAIHQFTWNTSIDEDLTAGLVIDVCHAAKYELGLKDDENRCMNATIAHDGKTFTAAVQYHGSLSGRMWHYIYGEIVLSDELTTKSTWTTCVDHKRGACSREKDLSTSSQSGTLLSIGLMKSFKQDSYASFSVQVRVGLSHISHEYAKLNLDEALPGDKLKLSPEILFSSLRGQTTIQWCKHLSALTVTAIEGDDEIVTMLNSAYYHTLNGLTDYTEYTGMYLGMDKTVHNATQERSDLYSLRGGFDGRFFSDLSLWDTYRTLHPWLLLMNEDLAVGIVRSMGEISYQQQAFPRWVLGSNEGSCMIGESGSSFVVDMISNGFHGEYDLQTIANVLLKQSTQEVPTNSRADVNHYMTYGYVSSEAQGQGSSHTLTYAFDDYMLSKILAAANDSSNAEAASSRSQNYRKIWSSESLLFCPRAEANGAISCARDPALGPESWASYVEGNALHWSWFVPHDVDGLISLYPSAEAFQLALENHFIDHLSYAEKYGSLVPNPYYWAGNEHSSLVPWLFNYGPDCTRTQYWTRNITHLHYSNTPHGIPGNDDYGAMSSWLLFTSLGLFPQAGLNLFLIGSPRVQEASLRLSKYDGSSTIVKIVTYNNSAENVYVEKLLVNGVEWKAGPFIDRKTLTKRSRVVLEFYMHSENNSNLCTGK
jgi:predicted alpha-1,2-mannosidase